MRAELIAEHASVQPGGGTLVGVHLELEENWHIYAQDPGDAGLPTRISWSAPSNVSIGPVQWPTPQQFLDPGEIRTFGYSGAVVLASLLTHQARGESPQQIQVRAEVQWLACKEICIPGSAELALTLPVIDSPPVFSAHAQLFERADEPGE